MQLSKKGACPAGQGPWLLSQHQKKKEKKEKTCSLIHLKKFYVLTGLSPESFFLGSHCCHLLFSWWDLWLQETMKMQPALENAAARPGSKR